MPSGNEFLALPAADQVWYIFAISFAYFVCDAAFSISHFDRCQHVIFFDD